jgi:GNAT superfamily N-acetyltransferase
VAGRAREKLGDMLPRLARLHDGRTVLLRLQTRDDRALIAAFFACLSDRSRYQRFHAGTPAVLKTHMLDALTDVDGRTHVGVVALYAGRVVGATRYKHGDVAITVTDTFQNRGLGRMLIDALVREAHTNGIEDLTFDALPDNPAARALQARVTTLQRVRSPALA